ncbi:hypothetical protein BOTBODRAFT_59960 [Botryobasidium botryosum FD-172 SS1]|uniref:AA1-like domain-containing protein n=1 Tax=Botryobasidium botryosum (strain FD-172 SS1) TaxID=930990 RepID=A0A067M6G4_BOTB1|nr:hypothetical protein BOTBODRAFT_59960 [Botryobasidium botryosum FD-172 SS1]
MLFPRASALITPLLLLSPALASPIERDAPEAHKAETLLLFDTFKGLSCSNPAAHLDSYAVGLLFGITYRGDFKPASSFNIKKTTGKYCNLRLYTGRGLTGNANFFSGIVAPRCIQIVNTVGQAVTYQSFEAWCDGP